MRYRLVIPATIAAAVLAMPAAAQDYKAMVCLFMFGMTFVAAAIYVR